MASLALDNSSPDDSRPVKLLHSTPFLQPSALEHFGESYGVSTVKMFRRDPSLTISVEPSSQEIDLRLSDDPCSSSNQGNYSSQPMLVPLLAHSPTAKAKRGSVIVWDFTQDEYSCTPAGEAYPVTSESSTPTMASFSQGLPGSACLCSPSTSHSSDSVKADYQRHLVLEEIVASERHYISSLEILLSVFLPALETVVAPRDLRLLFPCHLEPLIRFHQDFLESLEERLDSSSRWHGIVGDLFGRACASEGELTSMYSAYMNEFKIAMQTLAQYEQTSPSFLKTVKECSAQAECDGLSLAAFLLTPVQRLPRYELLLKQSLKHTNEDHPDCYYMETALEQLHTELTRLDRSIQACQFACTIARIGGNSRKRPPRRLAKRSRHSIRLAKIKRHFSQANLDDFSSPEASPRAIRQSSFCSNPRPNTSSSMYCSEENLLNTQLVTENEGQQQEDDDGCSANLTTSRAISCSDVLLLDYNGSVSGHHRMCEVDEEEEHTVTPLSQSPSIVSQDSGLAVAQYSNWASVGSTASSTSGFESQGVATDDSTGLEPSSPGSLAVVSRDTHHRHKVNPLSTALRMFRRVCSSKSLGLSSPIGQSRAVSTSNLRLEISAPRDFRHVQHGFSHRPVSTIL